VVFAREWFGGGVMITIKDIDNIYNEMKKYQELANVHLVKKRVLEHKLSVLEDKLKRYCSDLFNDYYEDKIDRRECEVSDSYDASVSFTHDRVSVTTDDPVSKHPNDTTTKKWKISVLLEDERLKDEIKELGL
jgi:hypothetical protein